MQYAVIGYGKMGKLYDQLLSSDYIVDKLPIKHRLYFSSIEEFLYYKPNLDLTIVCTPSNTHYLITKQLLLNNYNVLVEKPMCLSSLESLELETIAHKKHLILYQSTLERYNSLIKFFKNNLKIEEIARI
jgi:predicted dehydrogenase